jgi:hypothetical protein
MNCDPALYPWQAKGICIPPLDESRDEWALEQVPEFRLYCRLFGSIATLNPKGNRGSFAAFSDCM